MAPGGMVDHGTRKVNRLTVAGVGVKHGGPGKPGLQVPHDPQPHVWGFPRSLGGLQTLVPVGPVGGCAAPGEFMSEGTYH